MSYDEDRVSTDSANYKIDGRVILELMCVFDGGLLLNPTSKHLSYVLDFAQAPNLQESMLILYQS